MRNRISGEPPESFPNRLTNAAAPLMLETKNNFVIHERTGDLSGESAHFSSRPRRKCR
jgi:hypothetical protein